MKHPSEEKHITARNMSAVIKVLEVPQGLEYSHFWKGKSEVGGDPHCRGIAQIPGIVNIKAQSNFRLSQKPASNESPLETNV